MKRRIDKDFLPYSAIQALDGLAALAVLGRKQRGLTQSDVAAMTDVSLSTIVDIEKGAPSVQIGHWLKVLGAFEATDRLVEFSKPEQDVAGVEMMVRQMPKRVRPKHQML